MSEGNPYPKDSARYKMWERREAKRREKEAAETPAPETDVSGGDDSKRRKALDDAIEGRRARQTTDSNNA